MSMDNKVRGRRCSIHGITYPPFVAVCKVKDCDEALWAVMRNDPDENWNHLVTLANRRQADDQPESVYPHRHDNEARIYRDAGARMWVTHKDLLDNGYRSLTEDSIVLLNGRFFELQAYSEKGGAWLLEEIVTEGAADSLEPSMFSGG